MEKMPRSEALPCLGGSRLPGRGPRIYRWLPFLTIDAA